MREPERCIMTGYSTGVLIRQPQRLHVLKYWVLHKANVDFGFGDQTKGDSGLCSDLHHNDSSIFRLVLGQWIYKTKKSSHRVFDKTFS